MTNPFKIFKIKKEERWLALIALLFFIFLNTLTICSHWDAYTMGAHGGFWTIFTKRFCISGYDCWSWITVSGMRIHFTTMRHPLYLTFLYPMYLLNHWLIDVTGVNFAVFMIAIVLIFSALYSAIFVYRILREVIGLEATDSYIMTAMLFSFGHVMLPAMSPDHFIISMMLLSMTLYICGKKILKHSTLKAWQSMALMFFTAGMATSNGVKTLLAGLITNERKFFSWKYIVIGIIVPLAALFAIQRYQYYTFEIPQKETIAKIDAANAKKHKLPTPAQHAKRQHWIDTHGMKSVAKHGFWSLFDFETSRYETLKENFFGESFQLHQQHPVEDVFQTRPVFVKYSWTGNYIVEILLVLLLLAGIVTGVRDKFMLMVLSWFACDITLHLILGFGINEVYIMTASWILVYPISMGYLRKRIPDKFLSAFRALLVFLTIYLYAYNGRIILNYFL